MPSNSMGILSSVGMPSTGLRPSFPSSTPGRTLPVGEPWAVVGGHLAKSRFGDSAHLPGVSGYICQYASRIRPLPWIGGHAVHGTSYPEDVIFVRKDSVVQGHRACSRQFLATSRVATWVGGRPHSAAASLGCESPASRFTIYPGLQVILFHRPLSPSSYLSII